MRSPCNLANAPLFLSNMGPEILWHQEASRRFKKRVQIGSRRFKKRVQIGSGRFKKRVQIGSGRFKKRVQIGISVRINQPPAPIDSTCHTQAPCPSGRRRRMEHDQTAQCSRNKIVRIMRIMKHELVRAKYVRVLPYCISLYPYPVPRTFAPSIRLLERKYRGTGYVAQPLGVEIAN